MWRDADGDASLGALAVYAWETAYGQSAPRGQMSPERRYDYVHTQVEASLFIRCLWECIAGEKANPVESRSQSIAAWCNSSLKS